MPWESPVRRPGLAIHVRRGDGYREEPSSRAFPGWRAEEIFRALTEAPTSEGAWRALERVARAMGAREGTKPEDDPLTRSQSARAWTKGHAQGHLEAVAQVLEARGLAAALDAREDRELLGGLSGDALVAAALACTDAADFRRRIREQRALHGRRAPVAARGGDDC